MVGYHQTNQKTDTGKTLTRWPVLVDHNTASSSLDKVESRVESLMPDLRRAASNSAAEYARVNEEFFGLKQQACCQVHELLVTNGIDVSVKRVESAVNSYRVGR